MQFLRGRRAFHGRPNLALEVTHSLQQIYFAAKRNVHLEAFEKNSKPFITARPGLGDQTFEISVALLVHSL